MPYLGVEPAIAHLLQTPGSMIDQLRSDPLSSPALCDCNLDQLRFVGAPQSHISAGQQGTRPKPTHTGKLAINPSCKPDAAGTLPICLFQLVLKQGRLEGKRNGSVKYGGAEQIPHQAKPGLRLLWVACGSEDFLFSANRMNVAVSRAQCLAVMVASERLLDADCRTLEAMALVDGACRFAEMARAAGPGALPAAA